METRSMAKRRKQMDENVDEGSGSVALQILENNDNSTIPEDLQNPVCQSSLELLPRELISMIIEYAAESVHDLRLVSENKLLLIKLLK